MIAYTGIHEYDRLISSTISSLLNWEGVGIELITIDDIIRDHIDNLEYVEIDH